ncbi:FAD binding domain-containing protein [Rutstroemia sp. NJR-2017a BVV2]|nr:FAD binding domain-containing protein [Rutstroemia sp. NJR-2017a BVV2]
MDHHCQAVNNIASTVRKFYESGESYRVFHGSSNSSRPRHGPNENVVDISMLSNIDIDTERRIALVEPNVPMDRLVEATLVYGLIPLVVMDYPSITAGGGFSAMSGESSSFRYGFFNDTVNLVEIVLGSGDVVRASRQEREDLFHGAAGAAGTLGIVTLMELCLVEARKFIKTTYRRAEDISHAVSEVQAQTKNLDNDYIDGIVFSPEHGVVITGQLTDTKPAECGLQTFSHASDPWFYLHVQDKTQNLSPSSTLVEYIPLREYLFRYDRAAFWVGRQGYSYFKLIPFTKFFRWLLDDYSHTRTL